MRVWLCVSMYVFIRYVDVGVYVFIKYVCARMVVCMHVCIECVPV